MKLSIVKCLFATLLIACTISLKAQIPEGIPLLSGKVNALKYSSESKPSATVKQVAIKGQPFAQALQINSSGGAGSGGLYGNLNKKLRKGDVLWISFSARSLQSKRETGESFIELRVEQLVNGKYVWPPYLERGISFGNEWTETSIPFELEKDVAPEDIRVVIRFDHYPQQFELGPVTFINCGQNVSLADLPRTVVRYEGDQPDAPWRAEAEERIEKHRKGDLTIKVTDADGKPIPDATVTANLERIAFNWGTATSSERLLDTKSADSQIYRDTLSRYFNQAVFENEMKWKVWCHQSEAQKGFRTLEALRWLRNHNFSVRGHVMVWPSWQHSPQFLRELADNPDSLRQTIYNNIKDQTNIMYGQFNEWDVINEPYAHHDVIDILGKHEMVEWFKLARKGEPHARLFLNDYTMFHSEEASNSFFETARYLVNEGAPINGIGEQAHIGGTPPGIPLILKKLDKFATLGLPLIITEFDINSNDDDFKARYLGDFVTAVFSHPSTTGLLQWGFWEGQHWFPVAALWNKDWSIRPHGKVFTDLVTKKWHTNYTGTTSKTGECKVRGFCGKYRITVTYQGNTVTKDVQLDTNGTAITIIP